MIFDFYNIDAICEITVQYKEPIVKYANLLLLS